MNTRLAFLVENQLKIQRIMMIWIVERPLAWTDLLYMHQEAVLTHQSNEQRGAIWHLRVFISLRYHEVVSSHLSLDDLVKKLTQFTARRDIQQAWSCPLRNCDQDMSCTMWAYFSDETLVSVFSGGTVFLLVKISLSQTYLAFLCSNLLSLNTRPTLISTITLYRVICWAGLFINQALLQKQT